MEENPVSLGETPTTLEHYIREFVRNNLRINIFEINTYDGCDTQYFKVELQLRKADGTYTTISESTT